MREGDRQNGEGNNKRIHRRMRGRMKSAVDVANPPPEKPLMKTRKMRGGWVEEFWRKENFRLELQLLNPGTSPLVSIWLFCSKTRPEIECLNCNKRHFILIFCKFLFNYYLFS